MQQRIWIWLIVLIGLILWTSSVAAHASLVRSTPAAGTTLQTAPPEIILVFSEQLDPSFSKMELRNSANQVVVPGPGTVNASAPLELRLTVPALPQDSYIALWRVRSAVDGHITEGNLPFGIGVAVAGTALIPPVGAPDPLTVVPPVSASAIRWLNLLSITILLGGLAFALLIWRPAWKTQSAAEQDADFRSFAALVRRQTLAGVGLSLLAGVAFIISQAASAADVGVIQALGAPLFALLGGETGIFWLLRMVCIISIGGLMFRLPAQPAAIIRRWWISLGLGAALLLTWSLTGHGAALGEGRALAIAADWLHLAATVSWLGGFLPLLWLLRQDQRPPALANAALIPRFSRLAIGAVAVLSLTGLYASFIHIGDLNILAATTYGRALLIKLGIFAGLILAGAINLLILSPRMARSSDSGRPFRPIVRAEAIGGLLVLVAAGVMTSGAPSKSAWETHLRAGRVETATVNGVQMTLRLAPGLPGDNEFAVDIVDPRPGAAAVESKVLLRMTMTEMDMGQIELETRNTEANRYTARGNVIAMSGPWNIEVLLRRTGFDDIRQTFNIVFNRDPSLPATSGPAVASSPTPIPLDAVERARPIFATNCAPCHGVNGRGDGPAGATLNPKPADMTAAHVDDHGDDLIAGWIKTGFPGSAMPAFGGYLKEEQIKDLVAYVRWIRAEAVKNGPQR